MHQNGEMMKISERVSNILAVSKKARNSDKHLQVIYMQRSGMELTEKQIELFIEMPSMETIRRTRQQIQMEGKYPADKEVEASRFDKYKEMRQAAGLIEPERVLEQRAIPWMD